MKCNNCQKEISDNSMFCEYCAAKINANAPLEETIKDKNEKNIDKRIYKWKEKLIDLSKRNRLLNFKTTKNAVIQIIDEQPPEIYRKLVQNIESMEFLPIKADKDNKPSAELNTGVEFKVQEFKEYEIKNLEKKHSDKYLQTKLSADDLNKTLRKISSTAKSTNDDLGYNVLFMSLGSIIWYEKDNIEEKNEAPLILVPVEIKRKSISQPYIIKYTEEPVILNPALTLKFKRDFGINPEEIVLDAEDINPVEIFSKIQKKIKEKNRWQLLNNIYIGLFSFAKFVMYKDLDEYKNLIKASKLIETICGINDEKQTLAENICNIKELDNNIIPKKTYQILDADSSQQQAIQIVKSGNNLVIEGPPGTGKSQTIANIIAELLAQNKKVLFVSQKIAALEVVKNRLDMNGLAPYCIEIHGNKTNKKHITEELINTLEYKYSGNCDFESLEKLSTDINKLKKYSNELHTPTGKLQFSPFEAIGNVLCNDHIPDLRYIFEDYENYTKEKLYENKALFTNLKQILKEFTPEKFPWYGAEIRELNYETKIKLKNITDSFIRNINNLEKNIEDISSQILVKTPENQKQINEISDMAQTIINIPKSAVSLLSDDELNLQNTIQTVLEDVKQFNLYKNRVTNKLEREILKEDIDNLLFKFENMKDNFIKKLTFKFSNEFKYIKKYLKQGYNPNCDKIIYDLKNIKELKISLSKLEKSDTIAKNLFGNLWNKTNPDEDVINLQGNNLLKLKEKIKSNEYFTGNILEKTGTYDFEKLHNVITDIKQIQTDIQNEFNTICEILKFNYNKAFSKDFNNIELKKLKDKFSQIYDTADDLTSWFKYLNLLDLIEKAGLKDFYNGCVKENIPVNEYDTAYEVQFLRLWLDGFVFKNNDILKDFSSINHEELVKEFKNLDKGQIISAKERLLTKLSSNVMLAKDDYSKEANELKRQGKLQRIRKSLRQIILSIPNLFLELKPCIMMSPYTVAQLLDPEKFHFDVVIFDEASQLTTEDCIGAIIRADKLVVAGDTKQLPPTSFFKTVVEAQEEENEEETTGEYEREDLDSILDECTTSGFPQCMLKWHYRSKHEHLIAFSNKHLYKELYTFPSCIENSETLGIKFLFNEPKAETKENKCLEEAKIVANAVMEHARKHPEMSLGVATLNIKQKALIEAEIENLREHDSSCEDFFDNNKEEYFFVKNLESVQGDERDVIMISIGYFKNKNGVLSMNFGPINKDGGERRLNVLITRARYMVQVFSGIKASDFNIEKTNSKGVQLLQQYLDFAQRGEKALNQEEDTVEDKISASLFEQSVYKELTNKGYLVQTNVGCSGYKIDLAIRSEENQNRYIMGIECDGIKYNSCATVRDRDRLRQEVLERLGWKIYRIWSQDWFKNPQKQLDKLVNYIESVKKKTSPIG